MISTHSIFKEFADNPVTAGHTHQLSGAPTTGPGLAYRDVLVRMLDSARDGLENKPRKGSEDVTKGIEYQLGYIAAIKDISRLPEMAGEFLAGLPDSKTM